MRRSALFLLLLVVGCIGSTNTSTTTTGPSTSSTARPQTLIPGGLIQADPATLVPFEDATPIVIGLSHDGVVSGEGRWAGIRTEQSGDRGALISIVDLDSMLVVADQEGSGQGLQVGDDGKAVWFQEDTLIQLTITSDETPVEAPATPSYLSDTLSIFPDGRLGYLTGPADEIGVVSLVIVDGAGATVHELGDVTSGPVVPDDPSLPHRAFLMPDVAWDVANNRAMVISADEDSLVVVDLDTGETSEHGFAAGRSPGTESARRDSYLSPDGSTLFVATGLLEVSSRGDAWNSVASAQRLVVVDTSDWSSRLVGANADAVHPSPRGSMIATTGSDVTLDSEGTEDRSQSPVFLIDTATGEPLVGFEGRAGTIVDVQFSNDGAEMYVISEGSDGTNIDIVDVASEQLAGSLGFSRISLIGEAGLLSFHPSD
jgi:hypothetical protein